MKKLRSCYHNPKGEHGIGKTIVGLTWLYAVVWSVPALFRKPPKKSSRWKEYSQALRYNFSHEELHISDKDGNFTRYVINDNPNPGEERYKGTKDFVGQCFSSTTRGKWNGVRFAPASEVLKHPERWSYIEFEVDEARFEVAMDEARRLVGKKYDYLGILGFLNPIPFQANDDWFCSEVCRWFKRLGRVRYWTGFQGEPFILFKGKRCSPRRSAHEMVKAGYELKQLGE